MRPPRSSFLAGLAARVEAVRRQVRALGEALDEEAMARRPPEGGWSVAQVLDHVAVTGERYMERIRPFLAEGDGSEGRRSPESMWRPTLSGRLLAWLAGPERRVPLPAPRAFRPDPDASPQAARRLSAHLEELGAALRRADGLDLTAARTASPVSPLVRLNLGDCLRLMVGHAERHLEQAQAVREQVQAPSG